MTKYRVIEGNVPVADVRKVVDELEAENAELRAADRDHLAAGRGMERRLNAEIDRLREALEWIGKRCPRDASVRELNFTHREMSYDAGSCARAALSPSSGNESMGEK